MFHFTFLPTIQFCHSKKSNFNFKSKNLYLWHMSFTAFCCVERTVFVQESASTFLLLEASQVLETNLNKTTKSINGLD